MGKSSLIFNGLQWKLFPREEFLHSCDCLVGGLRPTELLINFPDLYYPRVHTAPDMPGDRDRYRLSATLLLFLLAHLKMRRHRRKTLRGQGVSEARFSASSLYGSQTSARMWGAVAISPLVTQKGLTAWHKSQDAFSRFLQKDETLLGIWSTKIGN